MNKRMACFLLNYGQAIPKTSTLPLSPSGPREASLRESYVPLALG